MCRTTKLTPELQAKIVSYIEGGNYIETACQAVGINKQTYYNWLEAGQNGKKPFVDFLDAIKKAEAEAESRNVFIIEVAAKKNWQAAAWYLERKHPKKWAKTEKLEVEDVEKPKIVDDING